MFLDMFVSQRVGPSSVRSVLLLRVMGLILVELFVCVSSWCSLARPSDSPGSRFHPGKHLRAEAMAGGLRLLVPNARGRSLRGSKRH